MTLRQAQGGANGVRGDFTIRLAGKEVALRPSFEALAEIEQRTGEGLLALATRLSVGRFGVRDAAAIVSACQKAAGGRLSYEDVGRKVASGGLQPLAAPLAEFLIATLAGDGKNGAGEAAAPAAPDADPETAASPGGTG